MSGSRASKMDMEQVRTVCRNFPGTTEDVKWGNDLCFCVAEKMYAVLSMDEGGNRLSFKTTPELFEVLTAMPGIIPAPYLARHHWVCLEHLNALPTHTLEENLEESYKMVYAKLPARTRKKISSKSPPETDSRPHS